MPARDDALPLYVKEQGAMLGKSGDELTVKKSGQVLQRLKLIDVSQVSLFGNVTITAQALRVVATAGIPIGHFSYGGWFCGLTTGLIHKNVELRAVNLGDDADTTGAVCGQLAGAYWGESGIPKEWGEGLARRGMIERALEGLLASA